MTREEICQRLGWMTLPKQSEMLGKTQHFDLLDRITDIVEAAVQAEREACAALVETLFGEKLEIVGSGIAAEIRARGKQE
jgi:uncharacterized protein YqcC (DUF446 family)